MDGLEISLTGFETSQADYDNVMTAFMGTSKELIIRTGWKFDIYSTSNNLSEVEGFADNYFPYRFDLVCSDPYQHSTSETTRSKTITTNNQEWSADDSSNDITTSGTVEAVPDIKVTAGAASSTFGRDGVAIDVTDATEYTDDGEPVDTYAVYKTVTLSAGTNRKHHISYAALDMRTDAGGHAYCKLTYQAASLNAGAETDLVVFDTSSDTYVAKTHDADITAGENEDLIIRWYLKNTVFSERSQFKNARYAATEMRPNVAKSVQVLNTADTTIKSSVCNELNPDAAARINNDSVGTFSYMTAFANTNFWTAAFGWSGATLDAVDDELDIADDGYIYFDIDTKYPITGIPVLISKIDITSGTPTIQISTDASTWYDIDTAIVDDVLTVYALDNDVSLHLKSKTSFYMRFDCGGAGTVTCSIKSISLTLNTVTIDAERPVINTGAANTFKCEQDSSSAMNVTIALVYRDRKWAA